MRCMQGLEWFNYKIYSPLNVGTLPEIFCEPKSDCEIIMLKGPRWGFLHIVVFFYYKSFKTYLNAAHFLMHTPCCQLCFSAFEAAIVYAETHSWQRSGMKH